jgi:hypothetical protein
MPRRVIITDLLDFTSREASLSAVHGTHCVLSSDNRLPVGRAIRVEVPGEIWLAEVIALTPASLLADICHIVKQSDCPPTWHSWCMPSKSKVPVAVVAPGS